MQGTDTTFSKVNSEIDNTIKNPEKSQDMSMVIQNEYTSMSKSDLTPNTDISNFEC